MQLAAIDGRDQDLHDLLADADRDTLEIAVGGLTLLVAAALAQVPPEREAEIRGWLADRALTIAGWPE